jgi:hypothetical protein
VQYYDEARREAASLLRLEFCYEKQFWERR